MIGSDDSCIVHEMTVVTSDGPYVIADVHGVDTSGMSSANSSCSFVVIYFMYSGFSESSTLYIVIVIEYPPAVAPDATPDISAIPPSSRLPFIVIVD